MDSLRGAPPQRGGHLPGKRELEKENWQKNSKNMKNFLYNWENL